MAKDEKRRGQDQKDNLVPPNLSGRDPEDILRGFMQVDPEKVKERLKEQHDDDPGDS